MRNNNLILNRMFSQNTLNDLIKKHESDVFNSVIERYLKVEHTENNAQIITEIYDYLANYYRNEYFYKNTLLNKLLLGKHSVNTTTALTQLPIGKAKADFVLINGKAVVYEIKTELDSFDRLASQIENYYKAFNTVCVVTAEKNYEKLEKLLKDTKVGICALVKKRGKNNFVLQFRKEAEISEEHLDHEILFKVLRKKEYESILLKYFKKLPDTKPVFYYDECLDQFKTVSIESVYKLFLKELKKRNNVQKDLFKTVPEELKSLMYFSNASKRDYDSLREFLEEQYRG
jgi:hypothetical protein